MLVFLTLMMFHIVCMAVLLPSWGMVALLPSVGRLPKVAHDGVSIVGFEPSFVCFVARPPGLLVAERSLEAA